MERCYRSQSTLLSLVRPYLATMLLTLVVAPPLRADSPGGGETNPAAAEAEATSVDVISDLFLSQETAESTITTRSVRITPSGWAHTRFQQSYNGVPVFEGEAAVHLTPEGAVSSVTDKLIRGIDLDTVPALSSEDAIEISELAEAATGTYSAPPTSELLIYARDTEPLLAWRVGLAWEDDENVRRPVYFVDAQTGDVVSSYDNLQAGTGSGVWYSNVSFTTYHTGGLYYLDDTVHQICTEDLNSTSSTFSKYTDSNDVWGGATVSQRAGVDIAYSAESTWSYFNTTWSWSGLDNSGSYNAGTAADGFTSCALLGAHWLLAANAAWDQSSHTLRFGNGGAGYNPFTKIDIVAHEWTHAIDQATADLTYTGESGALNESWSDAFGELVEGYTLSSYDWLCGDGMKVPSGDPLRDMLVPANEGQPDYYTERDPAGDVHLNSGIPNKAFSLLVNGGNNSSPHGHSGSMTGIGVSHASRIWWEALTNSYLLSGSTFADARRATLDAAAAVYGNPSTDYTAVGNAWDLVGVFEVPGDITTYVSTSASLSSPFGMAFDSSDNMYIADKNHHKILKVAIDGTISTFAGTGTSGYSGDGAAATSATLSYPDSTTTDGSYVYISDMGNNVIRSVTIPGGLIHTVAGTGTAGNTGDGGAATSAKLDTPTQVALDAAGTYLYIADTGNNRVRRIDMSNSNIYAFAGTGTAGFSGDGGAATSAQLDSPSGVITTSTDVYIADTDNGRIRKVNGSGTISTLNNGVSLPYRLGVSESDGLLYVPDYFVDKVWEIDLGSGTKTLFAGTGSLGYSGDGGAATSATLHYPTAASVDSAGNVYISDNNNNVVRKVFH